MFAQIIEGKVLDAALLKRQHDRWRTEVKPAWSGYLGSTSGITPNGTFVSVVRTIDEATAYANAELPEQIAWWNGTVAAFDGAPSSRSSSGVSVFMDGNDDAGFVQMMQATVKDRARLEQLERSMNPAFVALRPDVMGHVGIWLPGDVLHVVDWFSSEAEARAGEQAEMPEELKHDFGEWMGLLSDVRWFDIAEPWMDGA